MSFYILHTKSLIRTSLVEKIVVEGPTGDKCTIKCKRNEQAIYPEMVCLIECETEDFGRVKMGEVGVSPVLIDMVRKRRTIGECHDLSREEIGLRYRKYKELLGSRYTEDQEEE